MIKSLKLTNFRCFREHEFSFEKLNIVVGLNNAGKSTLSEALRIVSVVSGKLRNAHYREPPDWLTIPKGMVGCGVSLANLQINFENLFYRYGDPPAQIRADFGEAGMLRIYVAGPGRTHCIALDKNGKVLRTKDAVRKSAIPRLETLPQVAPVAALEIILTQDYVLGALSSRLAPLHFRNQLNLLFDHLDHFKASVEETWPGLQVVELVNQGKPPGAELHLEIRDGDFVGEISTMGHGVQMWLQTMWFLSRVKQASTVILDEPDVYMHADLQRKLIRYVRRGHQQVIVTTHSTEIMSEVNPEDIVVIDKAQRESRRADSLPAVQKVLTSLGSSQNVHLARLWNARRFLLVEGDDVSLLHAFQAILFPLSSFPIAAIPNSSFGGWGGWRYALGECRALKNAAGAQIVAYCFLDSDYHTSSQIEEVEAAFSVQGGQLHIWRMKEIENYLLVPGPIVRAIKSRLPRRASEPTIRELSGKLADFAEELRDDLLDGFAQEHLSSNRALGAGGANRAARSTIEEKEGRLGLPGVVSGKLVLHRLLGWVQSEFGVSLSALAIASHFTRADLDPEIVEVLSAIEDLSSFPR